MVLEIFGIGLGRISIAVLSVIFGILVIIFPGLLRFTVGIYLILVGLLTLI